ncbi:MAG: 2Fe-2S iron-sulfur cluster-binding protein [Alphaproteobacteria bacterium]|jgi:2Fe-2S ferredoxin|nr:2Fe-2S iron-sulfur cluster-binding protein [Alphaproteobacteria bacterium]
MPTVTFIQHDGAERVVELKTGQTLMDGAIKHEIAGIVADCGGLCACSTCHVYVEADWLAACGGRDELEDGMLDFAIEARDSSRLSCQIVVDDSLDGLVVRVPERQY